MQMFLIFVFLAHGVLLHAEDMVQSCKKTYFKPTQIHITENELYVEIDGVSILPSTIQFDQNGYYFNSIRYDAARKSGPWQCVCLMWNEEWREYCQRPGCGRSRPQ